MDVLNQERSIIGFLLTQPERADDVLSELNPHDVGDHRSRSIIKCMAELRHEGVSIEIGSITAKLSGPAESGLETRADLLSYKLDQPKDTSDRNLKHIIASIRTAAALRRKRSLLQQMNAALVDNEPETYEDLEHKFFLAREDTSGVVRDIGSIADEQSHTILELLKSGKKISGTATGFHAIDNIISGLSVGLHFLGAHTGGGKSTLAMNIGTHISFSTRLPVLSVAYEMSAEELTQRVVCAESEVPFQNYRIGNLAEGDMGRICEAQYDMRTSPLYLTDQFLTLAEIALEARRIKAKHDGELGLIIVDYIQIAPLPPASSREEGIAAFSRGLKVLSAQVKCPILALTQYSREGQLMERPTANYYFGSSMMKNDSHTSWNLYREDQRNPSTPNASIAEVFVEKNRGGEQGYMNLAFMQQYPAFRNLEGIR